MNLHDIGKHRTDPDIELVRRYMAEDLYQQFIWEIDPDDPRALRYRLDAMENWSRLDRFSTLSNLNAALRWAGLPERYST